MPPPSPAAPAPVASDGRAARRLACEAMVEVLRGGKALDDALVAAAARNPPLPARDEGLARAIATASFRHLGTIRLALGERLALGLPSDLRLFALLAAGTAQVLFLNVPDHAAVDLCVGLARDDRRLAPLAGVVNAVLRRIAREREDILAAVDALGRDTPDWLARRWIDHFGRETAGAIATAHGREPSIDLTVKADPQLWADRLGGVVLPIGSVRLLDRTPVRELEGYNEGAWWVQDAAASLPARLLSPAPGESVADLCAAPGGKTAQLAAAGARVVAVDRSPGRLERLRQNLGRLALEADIRVADVLEFDHEPFDAVLLDAPCTATGTIRRHPDVAWTKRESDVGSLARLQARLLDRAARLVRPGGRLIYSTCSLEPEEGERQIDAFLIDHTGFALDRIDPRELDGEAEWINSSGQLRTLPFHLAGLATARSGGLDGFFAARLVHRATP